MKHSRYLAHYEPYDHAQVTKALKVVEQRDKVLPALRRIWERVRTFRGRETESQ